MNFKRTNTKISLLEDYYMHFNEDHRLKTRHGNVEFITNITYIEKYLNNDLNKTIYDIGAGTGAYSIYFKEQGYNVFAVELVKHNLDILKSKNSGVNAILGNALDLHMIEDEVSDVTLLFGPMYHLLTDEDKIKALKEAKRITKKGGIIFISYYMNEYAILTYGFIKKHILECLNDSLLDSSFHMIPKDGDLYSMVRIKDINNYNEQTSLKRIKLIASDGASNYLRVVLNSLSSEEYNEFIKYHLTTCEDENLLGASCHLLDIVTK